MSRNGSLKKITAAAGLGLILLAMPVWCQFEVSVRGGMASGIRGWERILVLAAAVSPEWTCWLLNQKDRGEDQGMLLDQFGDMVIVKISL